MTCPNSMTPFTKSYRRIYNRCFRIGNGQIVVQHYGSRHFINRCGVFHSYNISSSELVLLIDTKYGEEREMVKVPPGFMEDMNKGYHERHKHEHRCELEHEYIYIPNVMVNKLSEQFFNVISINGFLK